MIWGQSRRTPNLPVSAAAMATTATSMTAATKSTTSMGSAAAKSAARRGSSSRCYAASSTSISACRISATVAGAVTTAVSVSAAISEAAAQAVAGVPVPAPVIPGAYTDEQAAGEPLWPVIPVRRATIGVIRVVSPFASGWAVVHWSGNDFGSDANPDSHLSICCRCRERQSQKSCKQNQAEFLHISSSCCPVLFVLDRGNGANLRPQHLPASGLPTPPASDISNSIS